jgi:predicted  nucleic acid-binding Zn-ribbon protein
MTNNDRPEEGLNSHYTNIILEEMRSQIGLLSETMESRFQTLDAKIDRLRHDVYRDMGVMQQAFMARFDQIEQRLDRVEQRLDRVEQRLDRVEQRLDGVEYKLDQVVDKVNYHDQVIKKRVLQ